MYVGKIIEERMKLLNINKEEMKEKSFIDGEIIEKLMKNEISLNELDEFDLELLCNYLSCDKNYFLNKNIRDNDFLNKSITKMDTNKSVKIKRKIKEYMDDFLFCKNINI